MARAKETYRKYKSNDVKVILGFNNENNRTYERLRQDIMGHMRQLRIYNKSMASEEQWTVIVDLALNSNYLRHYKRLYRSRKPARKDVRGALNQLLIDCTKKLSQSVKRADSLATLEEA